MPDPATPKRGRARDSAPPVLPVMRVDPEEELLVTLLATHIAAPPPVIETGIAAPERQHARNMVEGMRSLASDEARKIMARVYAGLGNDKLNQILKQAGGDSVFTTHKNIGQLMMSIMGQPEMVARLIEWGFTQPGSFSAIASKWAPKDTGVTINADKALILLPANSDSEGDWLAQARGMGFTGAVNQEVLEGEALTIEGLTGGP